MKKVTLLLFLTTLQPAPREYIIKVPETKINAFWNIMHNNLDRVTVVEYKELMTLLETNILTQSKQFKLDDSLKLKK